MLICYGMLTREHDEAGRGNVFRVGDVLHSVAQRENGVPDGADVTGSVVQ